MKHVLLVILTGLWMLAGAGVPLEASAQTVTSDKIRPGKEQIVLQLPKEQRWRRQRIPKDVSSIRAWSYAPRRGDTASMAVWTIETSTIDRRYFPVSARRSMTDRVAFAQNQDPGATVEILHEQIIENRTSVIFALFPSGADQEVMLVLAAEGPTAFHSVEIPILPTHASRELLSEWVAILRASEIR